MTVEKRSDLAERFLGLRCSVVTDIISVRLTLIDLQRCLDSSRPQLAMHTNSVAQQKIAVPAVRIAGGKP